MVFVSESRVGHLSGANPMARVPASGKKIGKMGTHIAHLEDVPPLAQSVPLDTTPRHPQLFLGSGTAINNHWGGYFRHPHV